MVKQPVIKLENVSFSFNGKALLKDLNLNLFEGEMFLLTGDSGSGLTTFLRLVSGLEKPRSGRVELFESDVHNLPAQQLVRLRQKTGFVFQHGALFDSMSLMENIAFPLRYHTNMSERDIERKVMGKMRIVGIEKYKNELPCQLNEECRKRGGFARALVMEPKIVFYDELMTNSIGSGSDSILSVIKHMTEEKGITSLVVSHNKGFDNQEIDRAGILKNGSIEFL